MIELTVGHLLGILALMVVAIGLSAWQRLRLEKDLVVATLRTIGQLLVVGYFLEVIFALQNPWLVLLAIVIMISIAAIVARNRISPKLPRLLPWIGGSLLFSTALTLAYLNLVVLRPDLWYDPQYLIPLAGIILGNAMNGAAIAGERFISLLNASRSEVETHLCLGATPQQATVTLRRESIRAGLIPTLNTMLVVGIVTLPGVFTGQILGGINPLTAALYQIVIMIVLAFATLLSTLLVVRGVDRQVFNEAAQLILP